VRFTSHKVKGKGRGKDMGVPTINLQIPKKLEIQDGIYAVFVMIAGKKYQGALHFGPIPQFDEEKKSLEVFLLNVQTISEKMVKESPITVEIVSYLRPIQKFSSVKKMVAQIEKDVVNAKDILR
jgi:riboflavin kinase/FMN adenylyltransferase